MQIGGKRSREETSGSEAYQDAEKSIKLFLKEFSELPIDQLERQALEERLGDLKAKLQDQAAASSVLNDILVESTAA